jgi:catechol 2,3-dioxygenase-like lactoylglutathione lyase family enzyme
MPVSAMDHFTILTDDLPATLAFYEEFLGLKPGARPPFSFPGAWLYAEGSGDANPRRDPRAPRKGVTGRDPDADLGRFRGKGYNMFLHNVGT